MNYRFSIIRVNDSPFIQIVDNQTGQVVDYVPIYSHIEGTQDLEHAARIAFASWQPPAIDKRAVFNLAGIALSVLLSVVLWALIAWSVAP